MKVLIAGAGVGGLCAALCLQKAGHQVKILERSESFSTVGAGLQLGANALKVLEYLDLLPQLKALAVQPDRVDFRAFDSGNILHSVNLGEDYIDKYGSPYLHIHRADLHSILLGALNHDTELFANTCVAKYTEHETGVLLECIDGQSYNGDCLVGADGIHSIVQQQLVENSQPKFTGNVAWRGMVSSDLLPADFMQKTVTNFVGPAKHMVIYYLREQKLLNFVGVVENSEFKENSWMTKSSWQDLKKDFDGWHPMVQTVIDAMDKQECYRWALYDQSPLTQWSSKRVTLLGDAAHSMLPFLASGAASAIEDARILQRALDEYEDVSQALRCYQRNRVSRTSKIQALSRQVGRLYHIRSPSLLSLAFKAASWKSTRTEAFLGDYNANTVTLK